MPRSWTNSLPNAKLMAGLARGSLHPRPSRVMDSVNRAAIIVRPKDPYFAWARALTEGQGGLECGSDFFVSVYLANASETGSQEAIIRRHFAEIFEEQLNRLARFWDK